MRYTVPRQVYKRHEFAEVDERGENRVVEEGDQN
jgi:hypothetical protein